MLRRHLGGILTKLHLRPIPPPDIAPTVARWHSEKPGEERRYIYPLDANSTVLDCGGFKGNFAEKIATRYGCRVFVFEPIPLYYDEIVQRLAPLTSVQVLNFGVGDRDQTRKISLENAASSTHQIGLNSISAQFVALPRWLGENGVSSVDLIKINIEGDEYCLLESMIANKIHSRCRFIQVQFHTFVDDCVRRREHIRKRLAQTHRLMWDYPFVWESWERF
jgi:FkbM family methyltransferase